MTVDQATQHIIVAWCDALQHYYELAKAERLAELHDRRSKLLDARGLHPLSLEAGRIQACESLVLELADCGFDPLALKRQAREDAAAEYWGALVAEAA